MTTTFTKANVKTFVVEGMLKPLPAYILKQIAVYEASMTMFIGLWWLLDRITLRKEKKGGTKS